jgi:nucleoside-diphosphate-sugar epimerase
MKILITGKNGYIAKSLYSYLSDVHDITCVGRSDFDLANSKDVASFMSDKQFDVVIHTAIKGGTRLKADDSDTLYQNMLCFYNLYDCRDSYKRFITFGSGAEFTAKNTQYGLSKRCINDIIKWDDKFINLRIFAVFDENELDTRFIKSALSNYINKKSIVIHQDKYMDFFAMQDLAKLVEHLCDASNIQVTNRVIDCCYNEKFKLTDVANFINSLSNYKCDIVVHNAIAGEDYTGFANTMPVVEQIGLHKSIECVYKKMLYNSYKH